MLSRLGQLDDAMYTPRSKTSHNDWLHIIRWELHHTRFDGYRDILTNPQASEVPGALSISR